MVNERWQPLLNNLGHACRKNKKYLEAIAFHEQALTIVPGCGATYSALGLCLALIGEIERAMDAFHSSLSKKPDDTFATTMLSYLVDQLAEQAIIGISFFINFACFIHIKLLNNLINNFILDEDIPEFPFPKSVSFNIPMVSKPPPEQEREKSDYNITCMSDMSMSFDD